MKKILEVVILSFFLTTSTLADSIKDFKIENISIGDSALDYFTISQLEDNVLDWYNYSYKDFSTSLVPGKGIYDWFKVSYRSDDDDFIIEGLVGIIVKKNYEDIKCNRQLDEAALSISGLYKNIMQGMGQWTNLDQQAYDNAMGVNTNGRFEDKQGNLRPIYPLKPYAEELTSRDNINAMHMDKNSYVVVTPELANEFPYLQEMLDVMEGDAAIDVIHTESATKGARKNVQDFITNGELDVSNIVVMDSKGLRFPQVIPKTKKGERDIKLRQ